MTQPRLVLPGDTVMVTRRTLHRHHLFRPDPAIRQLYLYTLAVCARQFGILVHAVTFMSTHEHLVVTDPTRRLPDFLRKEIGSRTGRSDRKEGDRTVVASFAKSSAELTRDFVSWRPPTAAPDPPRHRPPNS